MKHKPRHPKFSKVLETRVTGGTLCKNRVWEAPRSVMAFLQASGESSASIQIQ